MAAKKVLIVDDSSTVRQTLRLTLASAGYEVVEAEDGTAALEMVSDEIFDLLMTDLNMPQMDGVSFISEVRKLPGQRFTPIIILSGESKKEKRKECLSSGASGYIEKPFKPDQLLGVLRMVVPY